MSRRDPQLLRYLETFWGYGSLRGAYWFVGMEEGGAARWEEFLGHLDRWADRGEPRIAPFRPTDDLAESRWFGRSPSIQPYWGKISRLVLAAEGRPRSTEDVRSYQAHELATPGGDTCLLELLPLPSPSTSEWLYGTHSQLDILADRATYLSTLIPRRIAGLQALVEEHQPRSLIFVGLSYLEHWNRIAGRDLPTHLERPVALPEANTRAVAVRHPTSFGVTNDYFERIGRSLASSQLR